MSVLPDREGGPDAGPVPKLAAWSVHLLTASGAVWGLAALDAIARGRFGAALGWMALAVLIDGVDGALARRASVKTVLPAVDGTLLDNPYSFPAVFSAVLADHGLTVTPGKIRQAITRVWPWYEANVGTWTGDEKRLWRAFNTRVAEVAGEERERDHLGRAHRAADVGEDGRDEVAGGRGGAGTGLIAHDGAAGNGSGAARQSRSRTRRRGAIGRRHTPSS